MLDLIHAYENYLIKVKKASGNTIASYMRDIRQYSDWMSCDNKTNILDANQQTIRDYLSYLHRAGKSAATESRCAASLKNFYAYLLR